jgi:hypothetical protein
MAQFDTKYNIFFNVENFPPIFFSEVIFIMKEYKKSDGIFGNMLFVKMVLEYNVFISGNLSPKCDC